MSTCTCNKWGCPRCNPPIDLGPGFAHSQERQSRELRAWRELGAEMLRTLDAMTPTQRDDWFPDWFDARLRDMLPSRREAQ